MKNTHIRPFLALIWALCLLSMLTGAAQAEPVSNENAALEELLRAVCGSLEALPESGADADPARLSAEDAEGELRAMLRTMSGETEDEAAQAAADAMIDRLRALGKTASGAESSGADDYLFLLPVGEEAEWLLLGRSDGESFLTALAIGTDEQEGLFIAAQIAAAPERMILIDRPETALADADGLLRIYGDGAVYAVLFDGARGEMTAAYSLEFADGSLQPSENALRILADGEVITDRLTLQVSETVLLTADTRPSAPEISAEAAGSAEPLAEALIQYTRQGILISVAEMTPEEEPIEPLSILPLIPFEAEEPEETKGPVVWTSSNTGMVTVDEAGQLSAVGAGKAVVTASYGEKTVSIDVEVDALPCELCGSGIAQLDEISAHRQAICGVEGHCTADGEHSTEVISPFCDAEPQHTICEGDPLHRCDGEFGCGEVYPCSESNRHATCVRCGRPWCYEGEEENPVSHLTLDCGLHRACEISEDELDQHGILECGHAECDLSAGESHDFLPCARHRACEVPADDLANHALFGCGHAKCASGAESEHRVLACERHYVCEIPAGEQHNHGLLFCGHATCDTSIKSEHKLLPCGIHLACKVDADRHGSHVMLSCGHAACDIAAGSDHSRGACGVHFLCEGGNHAVCPGCAQFFCSEGDHVPTACGHYACAPDLGLNHEVCEFCGGWTCDGKPHGADECACSLCGSETIHGLAECQKHRVCEEGEHSLCNLCEAGYLCEPGHGREAGECSAETTEAQTTAEPEAAAAPEA